MKINKSLKVLFRSMLMKCGEVKTDKATLIFDAEELVEGLEVYVELIDEEGNVEFVPAEDGEYVAEGKTITVEGGIVTKITEEEVAEEVVEEIAEAPVEVEMEEVEVPEAENVEAIEEEEENAEDIDSLEAKIAGIIEGLEKLTNAIAAIETRLNDVEAKLAKVDETPAAEKVEDDNVQEEVKQSRLSYLKKH